MKHLARVQGLEFTDERVIPLWWPYKGHSRANEKIRAVPLPLEAEPS